MKFIVREPSLWPSPMDLVLFFLVFSLFHLFLRWFLPFVNDMLMMLLVLLRSYFFSYRFLFFFFSISRHLFIHSLYVYCVYCILHIRIACSFFSSMSCSPRSLCSGAFLILSSPQRPILILFSFRYSLVILFRTFNNTNFFSILLTSVITHVAEWAIEYFAYDLNDSSIVCFFFHFDLLVEPLPFHYWLIFKSSLF